MTAIKLRVLAVLVVVSAIAASSCAPSNNSPIVGAWKLSLPGVQADDGVAHSFEFDFNPDNSWKVSMALSSSVGSYHLSYCGTYIVDGQTVDCKINTVNATGQSPDHSLAVSNGADTKGVGDLRYTWKLKDSKTLALTLVSGPRLSSGPILPNTAFDLTKS